MESQIQQIFCLQTPPPNKNSTFSEHDHVSYQIKWNRECNNMQAHIHPYANRQPL